MRRSMTTREEVLAVAERWRTKGGTAEQGAAAHGRMETAGSGGAAGKAGARGGGSRRLGRQFASRHALAAFAVRGSKEWNLMRCALAHYFFISAAAATFL